jgi:hypothetical protein
VARPKRNSTILETARQRVAALKTFTPLPNFGDSLDLAQYEEDTNALGALLERYNNTLTLLDNLQNDFEAAEDRLNEKNRRVLAATGGVYGHDSNQYEALGGTRSSEHKRSARKKSNGDNNT